MIFKTSLSFERYSPFFNVLKGLDFSSIPTSLKSGSASELGS
jgi:hypothetical protein